MFNRFIKALWLLSIGGICLIVLNEIFGVRLYEIDAGLVPLAGLLVIYFATGSLKWPRDLHTEKPFIKLEDDLVHSVNATNTKSAEDDFLHSLEQSRRLIAKELEASRLALEEKWKNQFSEDLQKVEKTEELIRKSNVVESCLSIAKKTYHWQSWIKNQNGNWHFPNWIENRLLTINEERNSSITLESYSALLGGMFTERNTSLQTGFGFRDGENEICQYLYSTSDFDGTYFGRLLVKLNDELVLDVSVSRDLDHEYDEWRFGWGQIHVAKIGNWMSSILNLEEEFKGHDLLEKTEQKLRTHTC